MVSYSPLIYLPSVLVQLSFSWCFGEAITSVSLLVVKIRVDRKLILKGVRNLQVVDSSAIRSVSLVMRWLEGNPGA